MSLYCPFRDLTSMLYKLCRMSGANPLTRPVTGIRSPPSLFASARSVAFHRRLTLTSIAILL